LPRPRRPTGQHHALALTQDGEVFGWGACGAGQLGVGLRRAWVAEPVDLTAGLHEAWEVRAARAPAGDEGA
jgi:alpha-tubulin suppressor-like RCC1 family protein